VLLPCWLRFNLWWRRRDVFWVGLLLWWWWWWWWWLWHSPHDTVEYTTDVCVLLMTMWLNFDRHDGDRCRCSQSRLICRRCLHVGVYCLNNDSGGLLCDSSRCKHRARDCVNVHLHLEVGFGAQRDIDRVPFLAREVRVVRTCR
jgi:hypothetical protein